MGDPKVRVGALIVETASASDLLERLSKYSSWSKLIRIVARIRRLSDRQNGNSVLKFEEINQAGLSIIRLVQKESFKEEMQLIEKLREVPSSSKLFSLIPFIQDGVIRVGGR